MASTICFDGIEGCAITQQRVDVIAKSGTGAPKAQLQDADLSNAALDHARAGREPRALLRMDEAASYLRFIGPCAADKCRQLLQRNHVDLLRRGRVWLVRQDAIDLLLETGKTGVDAVAAQKVAQLNRRPVAWRSR